MKSPILWALFGFFFNFLAIAILHGNRWLKNGESRQGGKGWDSCRWLAINGTVLFILGAITGLGSLSTSAPSSSDAAASAGFAIGATLGLGFIFMLWLLFSIFVLLVGLMLRKKAEEVGPTGPLAAIHLTESAPKPAKKPLKYGETNL